jgi:hypothetical protein
MDTEEAFHLPQSMDYYSDGDDCMMPVHAFLQRGAPTLKNLTRLCLAAVTRPSYPSCRVVHSGRQSSKKKIQA